MNAAALLFVPVLSTVAGCVAGDRDTPSVDPRGTYDVRGTWSVGAPMSDGRTPGEVAADLLIEESVALSPIPGALEGDARDALAAALRAPISEAVDAALPPELQEGSELREDLAAVLADLEVASTMTVEGRGRDLSGAEEIRSLAVTTDDGVRHLLLPAFIAEKEALGSEWSGDAHDSGRIEMDDFEYSITYAALVRWAVEVALEGPSLETLDAQATASIRCDELAAGPVEIEAGGASFTISASTLESACKAARAEMVERLLGRFDAALLRVDDGELRAFDDDGDGLADRITSGSSLGGTVAVPGLPDSISPWTAIELEGIHASSTVETSVDSAGSLRGQR